MSIPPVPHGLNPLLSFDKKLCDYLKLDPFLYDLPVKDWHSLDSLAKAFIRSRKGAPPVDWRKACNVVKESLSNLRKKRSQNTHLVEYCTNIIAFLKLKPTQQMFQKLYENQLEEDRLQTTNQHIESKNVLRLRIVANQSLADELDKGIAVSQKRANTGDHNDNDHPRKSTNHEPSLEDIRTVIVESASKLHDNYREGKNLNNQARKAMSSGLSSTVDLGDVADQADLFHPQVWQHVGSSLKEKHCLIIPPLEERVKTTWNLVSQLVAKRGFDEAQDYIYKVKKAPFWQARREIICCFDNVLNILENQKGILRSKSSSEYDFLFKVWSPLLESLFARTIIRLAYGETTNPYSNQSKREQHMDYTAIAFKIDLRFIYDHDGGLSYDVGAMEAAKSNDDDKALHDVGKLIREGKDILDQMFDVVGPVEKDDLSAWVLRIYGLHSTLSSVHLSSDGLYVHVPRATFNFPTGISTMSEFESVLSSLLFFRDQVIANARLINRSLDTLRCQQEGSYEKNKAPIPHNPHQSWRRPTWYTPSNQNERVSVRPWASAMPSTPSSSSSPHTPTRISSELHEKAFFLADHSGWAQMDGRWFNIYSEEWSDYNPYE